MKGGTGTGQGFGKRPIQRGTKWSSWRNERALYSDSACEDHGKGPLEAGATRLGLALSTGASVDKETKPGSARVGV